MSGDQNYDSEELYGDTSTDPSPGDVGQYREIVIRHPAFKWLVGALKNVSQLVHSEPDSMREIREQILNALPESYPLTQDGAQVYGFQFAAEWDIKSFLIEQEYTEAPGLATRKAITLTGSDMDAQAATCAEYMSQTWPMSGRLILNLLSSAINGGDARVYKCTLPDKTQLTASIHGSSLRVDSYGNRYSIAEVGEQISWIITALRSSPWGNSVALCSPTVKVTQGTIGNLPSRNPDVPAFACTLAVSETRATRGSSKALGRCWYNLFRNPVIVIGFPIMRRSEMNIGLEISLEMMARLVETYQVNEFKGGLFLKGFSSMLFPTKKIEGLLVWHLEYDEEGKRISYLDTSVPAMKNLDYDLLKSTRHIVGWCTRVRNLAGTADYVYGRVQHSCLTSDPSKCVLEKVNFSVGKVINAGVSFNIGVKDKPVRISSGSYVGRLQWAANDISVVLWDEADRRGWLIRGTHALLHLVRESLAIDRECEFKEYFLYKDGALEEGDSPQAILMNSNNWELNLFLENETKVEDSPDQTGQPRRTPNYEKLRHRIEGFLDAIEIVYDHQVDASRADGKRVHIGARKYLEGWSFKTFAAHQRRTMYPMITELPCMGKGWVDFVRSIGAITLFGTGFGEIFRPYQDSVSCPQWTTLPRGSYYLAVCMADLKVIMENHGGNPTTIPPILSPGIMLYSPTNPFDACTCIRKGESGVTRCEYVQVPFPIGFQRKLGQASQIKFPDDSAIVLGQNRNSRWHYEDSGDPVQGHPQTETDEDLPFRDSGMGSSLVSSSNDIEDLQRTSPYQSSSQVSMLDHRNFTGASNTKLNSNGLSQPTGQGLDIIAERVLPVPDHKVETNPIPSRSIPCPVPSAIPVVKQSLLQRLGRGRNGALSVLARIDRSSTGKVREVAEKRDG
ncbi:hypothetical protein BCR34DRAFT_474254 [Clohesyomyces aquaticus]|uniref:Pfs domain protein n=1 Tax=Clohesyomyces aquaticus TaxID=1231657 RepID=A0A1Y2A698_9PLEO|nr:hypothetical protein BCR34DRAFT_474254 [Clohesyomyces aquaticus]